MLQLENKSLRPHPIVEPYLCPTHDQVYQVLIGILPPVNIHQTCYVFISCSFMMLRGHHLGTAFST